MSVASDIEVEQLFESLRPRIAEIKGRDVQHKTGGNLGCLLMVLTFGAAICVLTLPAVSAALSGWPLLIVPAIGVAVFYSGFKLWRRWFAVSAGQREEADSALLQPLATLLLPGATFTRASLMVSGYHPSLLMPHPDGVTATSCGRIDGHLLGRPVEIEERLMGDNVGAAWVVRVDLPFALAGHVRIHRRKKFDPGLFWREGFEPLEDESRRLGAHVELGPLGIGTKEGIAAPPRDSLPPHVVLTDALFMVLREHPDLWCAVTAHTLWIVLERPIHAFDSRVPDADDIKHWKKAAVAMRDTEAVASAILEAASDHKNRGQ
jgi:hypothetical protein